MFEESEEADLKKLTLKKLYIWIAAAIAVFVLFYWIIPVNIYHAASTLLAVIGAIGMLVTLVAVTALLMDVLDPGGQAKNGHGFVFFIVIVVGLFGSGALFIYRNIQLEEKELLQYGEITTAYIADGSSFATRKMDFTKITLKFIRKGGEEWTVQHSISHQEFERLYQGEKIPIVYSTRYPEIMNILHTEKDMQKYARPGNISGL